MKPALSFLPNQRVARLKDPEKKEPHMYVNAREHKAWSRELGIDSYKVVWPESGPPDRTVIDMGLAVRTNFNHLPKEKHFYSPTVYWEKNKKEFHFKVPLILTQRQELMFSRQIWVTDYDYPAMDTAATKMIKLLSQKA